MSHFLLTKAAATRARIPKTRNVKITNRVGLWRPVGGTITVGVLGATAAVVALVLLGGVTYPPPGSFLCVTLFTGAAELLAGAAATRAATPVVPFNAALLCN